MSQRHQSGATVRPAITEVSPAAGTLPDESAVPLSVEPNNGGVRVHVSNGLFDVDSGAGAEYVQGVNIRKVASGGSVEGGTLSNPLRTDPTGTTPQPATQSGNWLVSQTPTTSGGCSVSRTLSAANTTGINAKGSAGQVYGWAISNTNAAARYVKFYNKATAPAVGTDTPVMTLAIATGATSEEFTSGIPFALGIGYGITTGAADNDTGAPGANEVIVNLLFK
jgi:hypothetical protein